MDDHDGVRSRAGRGDDAIASTHVPTIRHRAVARLRASLAAAMLALAATGAPGLAQTFTFSSFDVQGNTRIETATILANLGVTPGQPIGAGALSDGFQRLQASGLFQSVEIVPRGSTLVVVVEEFPTISRIAIEGNRRLSDEQLETLVTSQVRRVYDPATVERDAAAITAAYAQAGRISATVRPTIIRRSENRVDLVFEVGEGRVSEVERISFVGNRAYSDRRLRRVLETTQAGLFRTLIGSDTFIAERVAIDAQLLRDFYLSRGYADVQVQSVTPQLVDTRDAFFITFRVQEGQQFRYGRVGASSTLPEIDAARYGREVRVRSGDVFSPTSLERTVQRLELLATREGLTFVRAVPQVTRNPRTSTLDVNFVLERGERVFVERIDIEGNATTLDRVIRRQFDTVEGDPFNPREIRAAAERIEALGYFSATEVTARDGSTPEQVIVDVDVEEQPTGSLGFGLNYSVERGVGVSFNFAEPNFLGRGQTLNFAIDTGSQNSNSNLTFIEPYFLGRDLAFSLGAVYAQSSIDTLTFDTQTIGVSTGLEFPVGEDSRLALTYSLTSDELERRPGTLLSPILAADEGRALTSLVGYAYTYSTIRRGLDPTRGIRLRFGQQFAGLGGDEQFVRTSALAQAQRSFLNEEVIVNAEIEGGVLTQIDGNSRQANRFFNRQSIIRGFESGGIGPRDLNFDDGALGGTQFVAARLETQFPIGFIPEQYGITGAAFVDVASIWGLDNTATGPIPVDDDFFLNSAAGVGILWDTVIGPLRFNFTRAINKRSFDREQNFDLTIETRF